MRKVIASGVLGCVVACGLIVSTNVRSQGGPTIYKAVAVVDTQRVFEEYTETQKAQEELDGAVGELLPGGRGPGAPQHRLGQDGRARGHDVE